MLELRRMDKETIKKQVQKTIKKDPLKDTIKKISLFGSYLRGTSREDSDIDLLIEFFPSARIGFFKLIGIQENIERALNRKVDLLTPEALSKYFRSDILNQAEVIYEK